MVLHHIVLAPSKDGNLLDHPLHAVWVSGKIGSAIRRHVRAAHRARHRLFQPAAFAG